MPPLKGERKVGTFIRLAGGRYVEFTFGIEIRVIRGQWEKSVLSTTLNSYPIKGRGIKLRHYNYQIVLNDDTFAYTFTIIEAKRIIQAIYLLRQNAPVSREYKYVLGEREKRCGESYRDYIDLDPYDPDSIEEEEDDS